MIVNFFLFFFVRVCMYCCMYVCRPEVDVWCCPQLLLHLIYLFKVFYLLLLLCVCKCQWACCGMGVEVRGQIWGIGSLLPSWWEEVVFSSCLCYSVDSGPVGPSLSFGLIFLFLSPPSLKECWDYSYEADRVSVFLWILGIEIRLSASAFISGAICLAPSPRQGFIV